MDERDSTGVTVPEAGRPRGPKAAGGDGEGTVGNALQCSHVE